MSDTQTIEITDEMIAAGAKVIRDWEDSDEPDARVAVRALLAKVLGPRAKFD